MSHTHYRGISIPDIGEDIPASLETMADTAGVITVASSVASARSMLTQAVAGGATVSATRPIYFDIGGIIYRADGTQKNSVYRLSPVNEVERYRFGRDDDNGVSRPATAGSERTVISATLDVKPYDRSVSLEALCYGAITGNVWLRIYPPGENYVSSKFTSGEVQSQTVPARGVVKAGTSPEIKVVVVGGSGGGNITFGNSRDNTILFVDAFPASMS